MQLITNLIAELDKVIAGYDDAKRKIVYALLSDTHLLLESVPGLAKTLLVETLQAAISESTSNRIQMTPDMKPQDIVGVRVFNPSTGTFDIEPGPVIGVNFLLADEINRTPGKTQSSLLSAMQERKVMINGQRFTLADPFLVLATMNPIEQEGTYPLPEAQVDHFGMKVKLDYVDRRHEFAMLRNTALEGRDAYKVVTPVVSISEVVTIREQIRSGVYVSDAALEYILGLVRATRPGSKEFKDVAATADGAKLVSLIKVGCSPRAEQTLVKISRVRAYLEGRDYILPEDIRAIAKEVMRHRIMLSDDAVFDNVQSDEAIDVILKAVPIVEDLRLYKKA